MRPLLLLVLCVLWLQAAPPPLPTIVDVRYEGLVHLSPMVANEISHIKRGEPLDLERIDQSIIEFYKQGYFQDIWVTEEAGVLIYHFVEKPTIGALEVKGYRSKGGNADDSNALYKEIGIKKGDFYDEAKIEKVKRTMLANLEEQGYYGSVVEATSEPINERAVKLTLEANRGEEVTIRRAEYQGAEKIGKRKITNASVNRQRDFMGWMWGLNGGKLRVNELERDPARISDYYMRKGFLDVKVSDPFLKADFNTYDAELYYKISEGEVYRVSGVEIILEKPIIDEKVLMESVKLGAGRRFNIELMRKDVAKIKEEVGDLGYAFARVTPDLDKDEAKQTVRIIYHVQPGEKVKINDVIISGNARTLDRVVRREVLLAPGEYYKSSQVRKSKNALNRTGYFQKAEISERRVSQDLVDLVVEVEESSTGEFLFGIGYGSYDGIMGNVSVRERNVFGSGINVGVSVDKSEVESTYNISLANPRVLDSRYSLGTSFYKSRYEAYDYTEKSSGFSLTTGRALTDEARASLSYGFARTELVDFTANVAEYYKPYYREGMVTRKSLTPALSYNSTDSYFFPKNGISSGASVEYAGLGGDEKFVKYLANFAIFKGVEDDWDIDLIFRDKARAGIVEDRGYLSLSEKFYLGGISSLRGYRSRSITPLDQNGVRIGGRYYFLNSTEVSYGLIESQYTMRLTLFYDFGMVGQDSLDEIQRSSMGAAIEWVSPIGPISFVFPRAINPERGDRTTSFEFTMGTRF